MKAKRLYKVLIILTIFFSFKNCSNENEELVDEFNLVNGLITIGDKLIYVNNFLAKDQKATFDFYYGENLGPFCMELFSAIPMHSHDAFNAEADRVDYSKNVGKWKVKKVRTLSSNTPPN